MGFLAPLYIAGLAAISLPLLFHLLRRRPRGRVVFSTLMFLSPSPPRVSRRSRLDHLLLLLLRAAALALLACAFARPFLREMARVDVGPADSRDVVILLDTSASMRRGEIWTAAVAEVERTLRGLRAGDNVALIQFDEQAKTLVDLEGQPGQTAATQAALIRERLKSVAPGWRATDLGQALASVTTLLATDRDAGDGSTPALLVLVTDLQEGARLDALQSVEWPERLQLDLRTVAAAQGNAGLQSLEAAPDAPRTARVRVMNERASDREQFTLRWLDAARAPVGTAAKLYLAPGDSRVVTLELPAGGAAAAVELAGDSFVFDNVSYQAPPPVSRVHVLYVGADGLDDPEGLPYFLHRALVDLPGRELEFASCRPESVAAAELRDQHLVVVGDQNSPDDGCRALRSFVEQGGVVVVPLRDDSAARWLAEVGDLEGLTLREGSVSDYLMLGDIDVAHPLFAAFADPRFGDFTKIRFWKYRHLDLPAAVSGVHVLAQFDNRAPALLERTLGRGRLLVLTSTWQPTDSQLALSSKFVPLVENWVLATGRIAQRQPLLHVGEPIPLPQAPDDRSLVTVTTPAGERVNVQPGTDSFAETDLPGIYVVRQADRETRVAVNLRPSESRTTPLDPDALAQFGVPLEAPASPQLAEQRDRQLRDRELEGRQQLWKWLLGAVLVLLVGETWLAGHTSRSDAGPAAAAENEEHSS